MDHRFQCPPNIDKISIDHQQFDADGDGVIVAPLRFKSRLAEMGIKSLGEVDAPRLKLGKGEKVVSGETTNKVLFATLAEAETEKLRVGELDFKAIGTYLSDNGIDIKMLNSLEKRLNTANSFIDEHTATEGA